MYVVLAETWESSSTPLFRLSFARRRDLPVSVPAYFRSAIRSAIVVGCAMGVAASAQEPGNELDRHMKMTAARPMRPGDQERANAVVAATRKVMDQYADYRQALAAGYAILVPGLKQVVYHFTLNGDFHTNTKEFDPSKPTSLLYARVPGPGPRYKIVGVMYSAPYDASEDELNRRIPLSVARWHLHTNLCAPPFGANVDLLSSSAKFGFRGSIVTAEACQAAGGRFLPHFAGWMVHVYAYETAPAKIWASGMDDPHGMQNDTAMPGMPM